MDNHIRLIRPLTLVAGHSYLRCRQSEPDREIETIPVTFIAYDPCPAMVVVRDGMGVKQRCPRDEVFFLQ